MIADKVKKNIEEKKLIDKGDMVVLGLSGGPDSVCLFSILQGLRDEIGFEMSCVHVNHMLRGKDAEADLDYCCKLCEKNDIRFFPFVVNVREEAEKCKVSFEEKGREIRYEKFLSVADEYKDSGKRVKIAVAHHFDDQAETIIMRIMRGTGTDGLAGMRFMREENGIPIVRPLLNIKKEDINDYCSKVGLMPRIDCTNEQSDYVRNRIRLELLPYMREYFNEKVDESICRLGDLAALDREYFDVLTEDVLSESEVIKDKVKTLYCELLGQAIKQELIEQGKAQNSIFYYNFDEPIEISAPAVSQILRGKRNITLDTVDALQETLNLPNVKSVFFPSIDFCKSLITQLTELILSEGHDSTKHLFKSKKKGIQQNLSTLATDLYDFFPDFPKEEKSYQIADSLVEWLIEFVSLVAQL